MNIIEWQTLGHIVHKNSSFKISRMFNKTFNRVYRVLRIWCGTWNSNLKSDLIYKQRHLKIGNNIWPRLALVIFYSLHVSFFQLTVITYLLQQTRNISFILWKKKYHRGLWHDFLRSHGRRKGVGHGDSMPSQFLSRYIR